MKNNILNINKDLIKRKNFIKTEIKQIILKSIIQNKNIKPIIRSYALYKISRIKLNSSIVRQNNICLISGRIGGVWKLTEFSRHTIKKISVNGNLQNIKISTW